MLNGCFSMKASSFVDFEPADIRVTSNKPEWNGGLDELGDTFHFKPHFGWVGAIEKKQPQTKP